MDTTQQETRNEQISIEFINWNGTRKWMVSCTQETFVETLYKGRGDGADFVRLVEGGTSSRRRLISLCGLGNA